MGLIEIIQVQNPEIYPYPCCFKISKYFYFIQEPLYQCSINLRNYRQLGGKQKISRVIMNGKNCEQILTSRVLYGSKLIVSAKSSDWSNLMSCIGFHIKSVATDGNGPYKFYVDHVLCAWYGTCKIYRLSKYRHGRQVHCF